MGQELGRAPALNHATFVFASAADASQAYSCLHATQSTKELASELFPKIEFAWSEAPVQTSYGSIKRQSMATGGQEGSGGSHLHRKLKSRLKHSTSVLFLQIPTTEGRTV